MMLFMFFTVVASLVFMLEPCADADCTFKDAFNTGYFLAITLTTVGYGDQIPTHPGARALAILTMMFGAVFLSMPIAVIGNKFEFIYEASLGATCATPGAPWELTVTLHFSLSTTRQLDN